MLKLYTARDWGAVENPNGDERSVGVDDTMADGEGTDGEELEEGIDVRGKGESRLMIIAPEGGTGNSVGWVEVVDPTDTEPKPGEIERGGESTDEGP